MLSQVWLVSYQHRIHFDESTRRDLSIMHVNSVGPDRAPACVLRLSPPQGETGLGGTYVVR